MTFPSRLICLLIVTIMTVVVISRISLEAFEPPVKRIFVSVASYRDVSCSATIKDMFEKASAPHRIFVGICEQNSADARESCTLPDFPWHTHVRKISIPHTEARGPTVARYYCASLHQGEEYFLQIDSHTTFVKNWDEKLIAEHEQLPSPSKNILSTYPHDLNTVKLDENSSVPILCDSKWGDNGVPMLLASVKSREDINKLQGKFFKIPFTSGGFLFGPGTMLKDVPYDPSLSDVFQGEEILYSARLWTHGYDIFMPRINIVLHKYGRKDEKRWHEDNPSWHQRQQPSMTRLKRLLGLEQPPLVGDQYGMGTKRSIAEYWEFAGLDPQRKISISKEKFCT